MARIAQDAFGVLRGLQMVAEAVYHEQSTMSKHIWANSSVREVLEQQLTQTLEQLRAAGQQPSAELKKLQNILQETGERTFVVAKGLQQLAEVKTPKDLATMSQALNNLGQRISGRNRTTEVENASNETGTFGGNNTATAAAGSTSSGSGGSAGADSAGIIDSKPKLNLDDIDAANLDISSITLKELEEILSKRNKNRSVSLRTAATKSRQLPTVTPDEQKPQMKPPSSKPPPTDGNTKYSAIDGGVLESETQYVENVLKFVAGATTSTTDSARKAKPDTTKNQPLPSETANTLKTGIELPELSKVAKQRRVPASRIGRMASFGGLFAGLGLGTINELTKGILGLGGSTNMRDALLSPANAERIVDTLCKVRGAALKIGQILSIQDSNVVSPQLAKAFERVRQAADYMPDWQVERVMNTQLGPDWRAHLIAFDDKPFAAASIGQVHRATLKNGMEVAIKIQYPGVAQSIESDIDNLVGMLKVWDVFPQGFFIDNVVRVAKRELTWEVDYMREAEYTEKYKEMIAAYPEYFVPKVIKELTTSSVLTTELVPGVPLDKCFDMSYEHRKHIGESVLKLCLRELFEIQCMQTDPNWSNFLYDAISKRLMLIDFGSTRFYQRSFIKNYRSVIMCAANNDRQGVLHISREMGFLTGYETKQMEEAHVDAVMILGEIFRFDGEFDFGKQNTTERLAHLVPTMVAHRLCPPPEEIYSIHRKLSGIFLLCARLNVRMNCRPFYKEIILDKFKE